MKPISNIESDRIDIIENEADKNKFDIYKQIKILSQVYLIYHIEAINFNRDNR